MKTKDKARIINIIAKNTFGETIYVESIKYASDITSFKEISEHVKKKLGWPEYIQCGYDRKTRQLITVSQAELTDGKINWSLNFNAINFDDAFAATHSQPITVITICHKEGGGLGGGIGTVSAIVDLSIKTAKIIGYLALAIYYYKKPYKLLAKRYGLDKSYVIDTIKQRQKWGTGFISIEEFRYKQVIETSIMRRLGYKKIGKEWVSEIDKRSKYPDSIFKGE